jgi:RNA polymerase sigma factor (sigma-70 family)
MARPTAAVVARAVRGVNPELAALNDRELLTRFADDGDQAAFAAVVARHTAMVLGVCKRVLHSPADAEDATQAVFLVLAKKAKGTRWQASAANWLYTTARKVAHNAKVSADRRAKRERSAAMPEATSPADTMSGRELIAALDDELDKLTTRYREPLVLCYLEGLTRDEAAARLNLAVPALNKQLERGRKKLHDALAARGCALGVLLLAAASTSSAGASPPQLHESILAAVAAGGSPSESVAALAQGVAMNGVLTLTRLAVLAVVGLGLMGVAAMSAADPPKPADTMETKADAKADTKQGEGKAKTIVGTVVGPDGKPMARVAINTTKPGKTNEDKPTVQELARTAADGTFTVTFDPLPPGKPDYRTLVAVKAGFGPDWVKVNELGDGPVSLKLAADDVPVKGRVTDLEGKAVPKAVVRVSRVSAGDLSKVWAEWPRGPYLALQRVGKELWQPTAGGLAESVTADADGRFEVTGVGRGRVLGLVVSGTGIETAACRVVTDPAFDPKKVEHPTGDTMPGGSFQPGPALYGPTFTHAGRPSQPVVGVVKDGSTGKPLAGIQVSGNVSGPHWWENNATTKTDADGKFTLHGVAKADTVSLFVFAGEKSPYLSYSATVSGRPGLTEIRAELSLPRGVRVKGRIVEKGSGKPVAGAAVRYEPLADNKHYGKWMGDRRTTGGMSHTTDADGRFEMVVLPGAGILTAQGETRGRTAGTEFTQVRVAKADLPRADLSNLDGLGEAFSAADGHIITLYSLSGYAIIDPKPEDETAEVTITFDRGGTATGTVVGADGKPATGVTGYKLTACYDRPQVLKDGAFTAVALESDHPRTVLFVNEAKQLAASLELKGGEKDLTVRLQPWGKLTGRLVDGEGKPVVGATGSAYPMHAIKHMAFAAVVQQRTVTTDTDGKFALDVPGGPAEYLIGFSLKNKYLDTGFRPEMKGHTVKPGETTDLGELKVKGE